MDKNSKTNFSFKPKFVLYILGFITIIFFLYSKTYSIIEGEVKFPANNWPVQTICLIDESTKEEKCIDDYGFPNNFRIRIKPGQYYIYSKINKERNDSRWDDLLGFKAFYTEYSKAGCVPLPLDKNEADNCNQIKENNKPIIIEALPSKTIKDIKFDWDNEFL